MSAPTPARAERLALCDLFLDLGPDVPTLCAGWTARDLAAHLVVRERRPDTAPGIFVAAFAGHTERVRIAETERPWPELVERVRTGPPRWNPMHLAPIDELANTVEYFVHHEDVRRAQDGWTARALTPGLEARLASSLRRMGPLLTRRAKVGLVLQPTAGEPIRLHQGDPLVTVSGPLGDLVLYVYGRKDASDVALDGPAHVVDRIRTTSFGL